MKMLFHVKAEIKCHSINHLLVELLFETRDVLVSFRTPVGTQNTKSAGYDWCLL